MSPCLLCCGPSLEIKMTAVSVVNDLQIVVLSVGVDVVLKYKHHSHRELRQEARGLTSSSGLSLS